MVDMSNFVEQLKEYLRVTSREQFLQDWEEIVAMGSYGPTVSEYLELISQDIPELEVANPDYDLDFFVLKR